MNVLSQKVLEIEHGLSAARINYISKEGSLTKNESHVIANKDEQKIVCLVLSQSLTELKAYSVSLKDWLKAESEGLQTEDIMKNLVVVRMFNIRAPQVAKLKGDVFAEIPLESVQEYLNIPPASGFSI